MLPKSNVLKVSIHTPTQGVTFSPRIVTIFLVFQSTHPRRVWLSVGLIYFQSCQGFNPHTHAGCDPLIWPPEPVPDSFNPHTHAGCDGAMLVDLITGVMFQSTHPRRVWLNMEFCGGSQNGFQSTHPRRVWLRKNLPYDQLINVSIHTPTQGVT